MCKNMTKNQGGGLSPEQFNKLATKDDLKQFLTKKDAKNFITKEDAKKLATKDDLKKFATKDDLKKFATKDALKLVDKKVDKIAISLLETKNDVEIIKRTMATKKDINKILTAIDSIVQGFKKHDQELIANQDAHKRMQKEINETRTTVGLKIKSAV